MNKKRIFALIGVIVLICLYIVTFAMALLDTTGRWFQFAIYATIALPILIWLYLIVIKKWQDRNRDE